MTEEQLGKKKGKFAEWKNTQSAKWLVVKHMRHAKKIEEAYQFCLKHSHFQCKFCKKDLGLLNEIPVVDFINHMRDKHYEDVDSDEIDKFFQLFQRLNK